MKGMKSLVLAAVLLTGASVANAAEAPAMTEYNPLQCKMEMAKCTKEADPKACQQKLVTDHKCKMEAPAAAN